MSSTKPQSTPEPSDSRRHIQHIDGNGLCDAVAAGAECVASKRAHLDEINVFPVPDGDTGTNLTLTLKAAADAAAEMHGRPLGEVASAVSAAVLVSARGNAGIIFAQFLRGFAREVQGVEWLYPRGLAEALAKSVADTYDAMTEPVEGTILTVIRESVEELQRLVAQGERDYLAIVIGMHGAAFKSLASTPDLLPVLKEAGVVDAGAEGYVDFLEGVLRLFRGEEIEHVLDSLPAAHESRPPRVSERDLKYRYCVEFMVEGPEADPGDVKIRLVGLGGSLVVVGSPGLVRVHIHTNSPEEVFSSVAEFGTVQGRKTDDMREQHRAFIATSAGRLSQGAGSPVGEGESDDATRAVSGGTSTGRRRVGDRRGRRVRIVTDSTADIPADVARDLGIAVVPLSVTFPDGTFRDGVDLTGAEFFARLRASSRLPTTSQPTPQDFGRVYEELSWETRDVLSIHLSSKISGTYRSASSAAAEVSGVRVRVFDSGLVCAPLGMLVVEAARAAQRGAELAELVTLVSNLSVRGRVFFTVGSLDHLAKGGRIGRAEALIGKLARVRPILTLEEGIVSPAGRAVGSSGVVARMLELAEPELSGGSGGTLGIVRADGGEAAKTLRKAFQERFGFDNVRTFEMGAVVGTHAGPGAWGVSYFRRHPPETRD